MKNSSGKKTIDCSFPGKHVLYKKIYTPNYIVSTMYTIVFIQCPNIIVIFRSKLLILTAKLFETLHLDDTVCNSIYSLSFLKLYRSFLQPFFCCCFWSNHLCFFISFSFSLWNANVCKLTISIRLMLPQTSNCPFAISLMSIKVCVLILNYPHCLRIKFCF